MNKKLSTKITLALLVSVLSTLAVTSLALAWGETQVYLEKLNSTPETLTVDLMVEDVSDLYGAEFQLRYDPAVLAVLDARPEEEGVQIEPGQLLPVDQGFVVMNQVDEANGTITFAMTLLNPAPAANGTGSLGRITFNILQDSPTTIDIPKANLVSSQVELIPTETTALNLGQNDFPWWIVGAGALVIGILAIGGGLWLVSKTRQQPATVHQTSRQEPARTPVTPVQRPGSAQKGQPLSGEMPSQAPPAK
jgi:hypothetical protein